MRPTTSIALLATVAAALLLAGCTAQETTPDETETVAANFADVGGDYRVVDSADGLDAPYGIAVTADGSKLYFSGGNGDASGIARLDDADQVAWLGDGITDPGFVSVDPDGTVYVVDRGDGNVDVSRDSGATWSTIGGPEAGFAAPEDVASHGDLLVVTDPGDDTLGVSRDRGATWTVVDAQTGHLSAPAGVDIDEDGRIYVVNAGDASLSISEDDGSTWRSLGTDVTGFVQPFAIAAGRPGELYVADPGSGGLARSVDGGATWYGSGGLPDIAGVAVGSDGVVYVTDGVESVAALETIPGPAAGITASWSGDALEVHWATTVLDGGAPVTGQSVRAEPAFTQELWDAAYPGVAADSDEGRRIVAGWSADVDAGATTATIRGLPAGVDVQVSVLAVNDVGVALPVSVTVPARP